jgi:hypothetical protein
MGYSSVVQTQGASRAPRYGYGKDQPGKFRNRFLRDCFEDT